MKFITRCLLACSLYLLACQKTPMGMNVTTGVQGTGTITGGDSLTYEVLTTDTTGWFGVWNLPAYYRANSTRQTSLTYEVLTTDTTGWFGVWNLPDNMLASNGLDSASYGSPIYFRNGWRYTFIPPATPFQAFISVANRRYTGNITLNLYRGRTLIKSVTNDAMPGVAKMLVDVAGEALKGTEADPVITYEVLVSNKDTTKFESDGWIGEWTNPDGTNNSVNNPLLRSVFAYPSGWKYSFKPQHLPFTMRMAVSPYTKAGATVTTNFYVNNNLVKSVSSRDWQYDINYTIQ